MGATNAERGHATLMRQRSVGQVHLGAPHFPWSEAISDRRMPIVLLATQREAVGAPGENKRAGTITTLPGSEKVLDQQVAHVRA